MVLATIEGEGGKIEVHMPDPRQETCVHPAWEMIGEQHDWDGTKYRVSHVARCTACGFAELRPEKTP